MTPQVGDIIYSRFVKASERYRVVQVFGDGLLELRVCDRPRGASFVTPFPWKYMHSHGFEVSLETALEEDGDVEAKAG